MHQQGQAELLSQIATLLESIYNEILPVTESLQLRHLVDCLCHPSAKRERSFRDTSGIDEKVKALKCFKANLKRRSDARDKLTTKRLMDLPDDARAILLSSIALSSWIRSMSGAR